MGGGCWRECVGRRAGDAVQRGLCVCVCVCVPQSHRDTVAERQVDRQTEMYSDTAGFIGQQTHVDRQTGRQADR